MIQPVEKSILSRIGSLRLAAKKRLADRTRAWQLCAYPQAYPQLVSAVKVMVAV